MARHIHWPEQSRRKPLKWYQQDPDPFFTSRPSSRMEKQLAEQATYQWHYGSQGPCNSDSPDFTKASLNPGARYARTSLRLEEALKGQYANDLPDERQINPECVTFVCCFPFYGVLIARLQSTVRAFYSIEGSSWEDFVEGCFCPRFALLRAEYEILYQEGEDSDVGVTVDSAYTPETRDGLQNAYPFQPPMEIGSLSSVLSQASDPPQDRSPDAPSTRVEEIEKSSDSLSTIPELSREASGGGIDGDKIADRQSPKKQTKAHDLGDDSTVPIPTSKITFPRPNLMDKHWFLAPAKNVKEHTTPDAPAAPDDEGAEITENIPAETKPVERGRWRMFRRSPATKAIEVTEVSEPSATPVLEVDAPPSPQAGPSTPETASADEPEQANHRESRFAEHLVEKTDSPPTAVPVTSKTHQLSDDPVFTLPSGPSAGKQTTPEATSALKTEAEETSQLPGDGGNETETQDQAVPLGSSASSRQDKGFVAAFFSGIAQPLRSTQNSSVVEAEVGETQDNPAKDTANVAGEGLEDDKVVESQ